MKIVFFGTSEFAAKILEDLLKKTFNVVAVVTRPDMPQGRSLRLSPPPVKQFIEDSKIHIDIHQPIKASTVEFQKILDKYQADLFLVVAYGEILKENILSIPKKACINIHASLLPHYRGAAPIQRCIMDGCSKTGITIIEMVRKMDAGDVIASREVTITPEMNFKDVEASLLNVCFTLVPEVIKNFDEMYSKKIKQDESLVTYAAKITAEDMLIDWGFAAKVILDKIRALSPVPCAYCQIIIGGERKRLKIKNAKISDYQRDVPGEIFILDKSLYVSCKEGSLELIEVQLEGKKSMMIPDFLQGVHPPLLSAL